MASDPVTPALLVLDTNIVLDLLVFNDPAAQTLQAGLALRKLDWIATPAMRDELERVLGYSHIAARLALSGREALDMLADFDRHVRMLEAPCKAPLTCSDADDQKFIDLAVAHQCLLLSKDAAVLVLKGKLAALQVSAFATLPAAYSRFAPSGTSPR